MPPKPVRRPGELVFSVSILLFGIVAFWQSYRISGLAGLTTAGVFPMLATATMIVAGLSILMETARKDAPEATDRSVFARFFVEIMPPRHIVVIGLVLLYLAVLPLIGFIAASGLFLLVAFQYLWRKNLLVSLVLTAVSLGAIYLLFRVVFQVVLPKGSLLAGLI